jgi:uncharacterized protein (TIGR00661 family)
MKRVLVTPLDWGLGHASRCIPVVRELQRQGCEVLIGGSGDSLELLRKEFPELPTFILPGYHPRYPRSGSMVWTMGAQLPRFMRVIAAEHECVKKIIAREKVDLVISDNRYGCSSPGTPSIFITHQSNIIMPNRFGWLRPIVRILNERMINRFDRCWLPDLPGEQSLAGDLISFDQSRVRIQKEFIGWLSHFEARKESVRKYDVVAVLSGPEPQRTLLENIVARQLKTSSLRYRIVRGLPSADNRPEDEQFVNVLTSAALQNELEAADLVIARSGFSTVMDMQALEKNAVLIPTPGQTEQEYLAKRLMDKGIAFSMKQDAFHLETAITESRKFSGFRPMLKNTLLKDAVTRLLA